MPEADVLALCEQLDEAPTDPYEYASWLALRQEAVPTLTDDNTGCHRKRPKDWDATGREEANR